MATKYAQHLTAADSTFADGGCTIAQFGAGVDWEKNRLTSVIASGSDTADTAYGTVTDTAKLPAGTTMRLRSKITIPANFAPRANFSVLVLFNTVNTAGAYNGTQVIGDVFITSARKVGIYTSANVLNAAGGAVVAAPVLDAAGGVVAIELALSKNGVRQMWIDGTLVINETGLTGSTGLAVPKELRYGIDHYDALGTDPGLTIVHRLLQLTDDAATPIVDPFVGAKNVAGIKQASYGPLTATNITPAVDLVKPVFLYGEVNGTAVTLYFDKDLNPAKVPVPGQFQVLEQGVPVGVATVDSVVGKTVKLTLSTPIAAGAANPTFNYTK